MKSLTTLFNSASDSITKFLNGEKHNSNLYIGIFSILVFLWTIMYAIPSLFVALFNTLLGNVLLLLAIIGSGMKNRTMGLFLAVLFIIIYQFSHMTAVKEGFAWSNSTTTAFINYKIKQFDGRITLKQAQENLLQTNHQKWATDAEALSYIQNNGVWPWSGQCINALIATVQKGSPNVNLNKLADEIKMIQRLYPQEQLTYMMAIQNQNTLNQGIKGVIGYPSTDKLVCSNDGHMYHYNSKGKKVSKKPVNNADLPNLIPGFNFINSPCNPCDGLNGIYDCPYVINTDAGSNNTDPINNIPAILQYVWKLGSYSNVITPVNNTLK